MPKKRAVRIGRPPLPESERKAKGLHMFMTNKMHKALAAAAKQHRHSVNSEITKRLHDTLRVSHHGASPWKNSDPDLVLMVVEHQKSTIAALDRLGARLHLVELEQRSQAAGSANLNEPDTGTSWATPAFATLLAGLLDELGIAEAERPLKREAILRWLENVRLLNANPPDDRAGHGRSRRPSVKREDASR